MRERCLGIDLARFAEGYPTLRQAGGRVEQDPGDWLRLIGLALHGFSDLTVGFGCLPSQVNTHDFVNAQGQVPAILWQRTRRSGLACRFRLTRRIRWRVRHRPPGTQAHVNAFEAEAKARGCEVNVIDTAGDVEAVIARMEDSVTRHVNAIGVNVDPVQNGAGLQAAAVFKNYPDITVLDRATPDVQNGGITNSRAKAEAILAGQPRTGLDRGRLGGLGPTGFGCCAGHRGGSVWPMCRRNGAVRGLPCGWQCGRTP